MTLSEKSLFSVDRLLKGRLQRTSLLWGKQQSDCLAGYDHLRRSKQTLFIGIWGPDGSQQCWSNCMRHKDLQYTSRQIKYSRSQLALYTMKPSLLVYLTRKFGSSVYFFLFSCNSCKCLVGIIPKLPESSFR